MSLGVKSLWRARSRIGPVQGFSLLVPRESRNLLRFNIKPIARRSFSSPTEPYSSATWPQTSMIQKYDVVNKVDSAFRDAAKNTSQRPLLADTASSFPSTARRRAVARREIKTRVPSSRAAALIKPPIQYPSRRAFLRSLRKHTASARRQALHEYNRSTLDKSASAHDWRSTLDFMVRHTPKADEILDFKVGIGRRAAAQAREALSDLDTNLWQIQQRHQCKIRVEPAFHDDAPLIINLSGTNFSVREALLELVRVVGKVSAVRVLDPALAISSPEVWKGSNQGQHPIRLLRDGEYASEDNTITVYGHVDADFFRMVQRSKHRRYQLTTRADKIPRPTVWTKTSFEQYVASLVFGRVPTHLHQSLYPVGLDHQATVVHLLVKLFTSEDLRAAVSLTALKMALQYILSRGPVFRPAARDISYQAELQHLPLDAEVFQTFLISASRAGDLQGFNSILRAMQRKGHYMRVETWKAFLAMIQDPRIKYYIMRRMRSRGLHRLQPILDELGRQAVMLDLDRRVTTDLSIQTLLHAQDRKYGPSWLNTITLNRMLDVIGSHGNLEACHELLDLVARSKRVEASHFTLNTMITHTRSIPAKIALLSRWPGLEPDAVTYQMLFSTAWKQRLPNMLRVIWRYGVFARLTSSKMRHVLTTLMHQESSLSNNRAFLKAWEDVILGRSELAAGRLLYANGSRGLGATQLMKKYIEDAGDLQPLVGLAAKLQEAYDMDMTIHKQNREGIEMSFSMRESLTVNIPLGVPKTGKRGPF